MKVTLIGGGCGTAATLTGEARRALAGAELVLGARRLLEGLPDEVFAAGCERLPLTRPEEIVNAIRTAGRERVCVLFSGDSGFYSGARRLLPLLEGWETEVLPGVSSVQVLAARLGRPWQDWRLRSAHGVACDPVAEVCGGRPVCFLTGGKTGPAELCRQLAEAGLETLPVAVGEDLTGPGERITRGTAGEFAKLRFPPLSVLLAEAAPRPERRTPGLPDECFRRLEGVPMTKREVRTAALARLAAGPDDICWDIGAGTGSVAIELALQAKGVWGVERNPAALALAEENRRALGAWNLRLIAGEAPAALEQLPDPDAVFIGGSGGRLETILRAVHGRSPRARICVSAIALETLHRACALLEELDYAVEITQLAVSRSRRAGGLHMMLAQNAVYLIGGTAP